MPPGTIVQFPFRGGIDEKTDPKSAPPGTLATLKNARQRKTGRIDMRYGSTQIGQQQLDGNTVDSCARLHTRGPELVLVDGGGLLQSYAGQYGRWAIRDALPEAVASRSPVKHLDVPWTDPDMAIVGNFEVYSWRTNGGVLTSGDVYAMVRDKATGAVVMPATKMTTANSHVCPRLVVAGTSVGLFYGDLGSNNIYARFMQTGTPTVWAAAVAVVADADITGNNTVYDVCSGASGTIYLAYWATGAAPKIHLKRVSVLGAVLTSGVVTGNADTQFGTMAISVDPSEAQLWIVWGATAPAFAVKRATANPTTLVQNLAESTLSAVPPQGAQAISALAGGSTQCLVVVQWLNPNLYPTEGFFCTTAGAVTSVGSQPWACLHTKLFTGYYQVVYKGLQNTFVLVSWATAATAGYSPARPVAVVAPRIAFNASGSGQHAINHLSGVVKQANTVYECPISVIADAIAKGALGLHRARFDFADQWLAASADRHVSRWMGAEMDSTLYLSGGIPCAYDGNQLSELGFFEQLQSSQISLTPANAGGNMNGPGTYGYQFYWEWVDAQGNVHRSAPSAVKSVSTTGAGNVNKVTITVPTLSFTLRARSANPIPKPYLVVCRTAMGGPSAQMYRVTLPDSVTTALLNDPTTATLTYVDTLNDTTLQTQPILYTATGNLESHCPPSLSCIIKHRNRLFGIGEDGRTVWASTELVAGEAPRWNDPILTISMDVDLVALGSMDDKLILWGADSTWFVQGDGPNQAGLQNTWTTPEAISLENGCIDPRSVMRNEDGLYYQGQRGFYMLSRALEIVPIKAPEDTLDGNSCIFDAQAMSTEDALVWACRPAPNSTSSIRLHFDDFHKTWSVDYMRDGGSTSQAISALVEWNGALYWSTDQGKVFHEDPSTFLDGGAWFDASWETQWISAGGPMAFQRVRKVQVLGERLGNHDLKVSLAFDYSNTYVQSFTWSATRNAFTRDVCEMRVGAQNGANPRCRAIRVKVEMLTPTGLAITGNVSPAIFSALGLEIVPMAGMPRLGAANART